MINLLNRFPLPVYKLYFQIYALELNLKLLDLTEKNSKCDIRPEWPKCNLCRLRVFSSEPSGLVVITN